MAIDRTNDAAIRSWVASANGPAGDFSLQNLPFAIFRIKGSGEPYRAGVAIGHEVLDLSVIAADAELGGIAGAAAAACIAPELNGLLALGPDAWQAFRHALFDMLAEAAPSPARRVAEKALVPQSEVEFKVPMRIGDYTDFYTSFDHAQNIGRLFSAAASVVSPNFRAMPLAYHGRASSVVVSGHPVRRPAGQTSGRDGALSQLRPSAWLDYELELGAFVGVANPLGESVAIGAAWSKLFGLCLLNDWSARDLQLWEMTPLGPFLSKSFTTTVSPWVVTMQALEPFRVPLERPGGPPDFLDYLDDVTVRNAGALDVRLQTWLQTAARETAGLGEVCLSTTSFRHQYWTLAQMVAHHTVGGCNLNIGDLIGTGTISGPSAGEAGAMIELSRAGRDPVRIGEVGGSVETRGFLEDGDTVSFRGWCEKPGFARIGFGECRGRILPARELAA